jgi:D-alanine--poly(phosphoribitol) ligase subunit 1
MDIVNIIDSYADSKKIAHVYRESSMSYGELKEKSDALANFIIEELKDKKTPILIYGHKEHLMLISFLACIKAGHAYIPVDSSIPEERIKDIIKSSGASFMLNFTDNPLDFYGGKCKNKNEVEEILFNFTGYMPKSKFRLKPLETCYIIYTSGSTGNPKGVEITLANLLSFIKWGLSICKINKEEVFMNQAPFSFDLSVMDLYLSLVSGSTLFSIDKEMISNLKELFQYLSESNISIWISTPSFAEMCLASTYFNNKLLPGLKQVVFCGETLTNRCARDLQERFGELIVTNCYGPTEATVAVTAIDITTEMCKENKPLPVGFVKKDCDIIIVDMQYEKYFIDDIYENILREGEKGEILILGDSVAAGYYNNKEITDKSFFDIKLNGTERHAYRTGDEGYIKDGILYYCGRIGSQIKLNGYRIELGDIENNLRKLSNIKNVVVLPVYKHGKVQYLSAVVVLKEKSEEEDSFLVVSKIKKELKQLIPDYMIPRKIIIKDVLPMNENAKVNRKLLMEEF